MCISIAHVLIGAIRKLVIDRTPKILTLIAMNADLLEASVSEWFLKPQRIQEIKI